MAKSTNYRGIHISVIYEYGYDYYEIREINKGKKWNAATLFSTLKEAKQYIDDHYDELVKLCNVKESKSYARKSLKEDSLDDIIPMGHSEYFDTLVEFFKDNDVPIRISHTANGGKICYVENDMEFITVIFKSPKRGYELLKTIEMYADGSTYLSRGKGGAWHSNRIPLEEVYVWDMDNDKFVNYKSKVLKNIDYNDIVESKKSTRKSLREMFGNEGIVDDFVDFLIYDCGYDEKTVKKYFYKKYKLNGLDVIPIKLYIQIKNEIEDVLGYNDIM